MTKKLLLISIAAMMIADLCLSFVQHTNMPLDGDIAEAVVPAEHFKPLFENPFGFDVFFKDKSYPNPNRFFSYYSFRGYLSEMPLFLQNFTDPISSVYLACGIFKTLLQLFMIMLLATAVSGTARLHTAKFLWAAFLVTPFFQTHGFNRFMGIIDWSVSYTFNYAFSIMLLMLVLIPFILENYFGRRPLHILLYLFIWIPLAIAACLSGPLNPGISMILGFLVFLRYFIIGLMAKDELTFFQRLFALIRKMPSSYYRYLIPLGLLSFYSFILGQHNSNNNIYPYSLSDLYSRLPYGIFHVMIKKLAFPVLLSVILLNIYLIKRYFNNQEAKKILTVFAWAGIFIIFYLLLLPLGGYRDYRPWVVRYDTLIPVTLSLIYIFAISTLFLASQISGKWRYVYIPLIATVLFAFSVSDKTRNGLENCERNEIKRIAESEEDYVGINPYCTVLSWDPIYDPAWSDMNCKLLMKWGIIQKKKFYYNLPKEE